MLLAVRIPACRRGALPWNAARVALALLILSAPLRAEPARPVPREGDLEVLDAPIPGRIRDGVPVLMPGAITMAQGLSPLDTSLAGRKNPNAIMLGVGNRISFCPAPD